MNINTTDDDDWVLVDAPPPGERKELPADYWEQEAIDTEPTPEDIEAEAYIDRQAELFEEYRQKLVTEYNGLYVLFEDGKVLDADKSQDALIMRAYAKTGPRTLFVKKVLPEMPPPERIFIHL